MGYIVFAILLVIALPAFLVWLIWYSDEEGKAKAGYSFLAIVIFLVCEGGLYWGNSGVQCAPNNLILVSSFGNIEKEVYGPGYNWVTPWADTKEVQARSSFDTQELLTVPICDSLLQSVTLTYLVNNTYVLDKTKVWGIAQILGLDFQAKIDEVISKAAQYVLHQEVITTKTPFNLDLLQKNLQRELDSRVWLQLEHIGVKKDIAKGAITFTPPILKATISRTIQTQTE